jgi:hypothetical protein
MSVPKGVRWIGPWVNAGLVEMAEGKKKDVSDEILSQREETYCYLGPFTRGACARSGGLSSVGLRHKVCSRR